MSNDKIESLIEVARIHESHLLLALNDLAYLFPMTEEKVGHLTRQEFILVDFLINRFCRLQDFMGSSLIDAVLIYLGEYSESFTMIDKMNKLEKFHVIEDAHTWQDMRKLRNHLIHEYPGQPELVAKFLNQAYPMSYELLKILNNLLGKLNLGNSS